MAKLHSEQGPQAAFAAQAAQMIASAPVVRAAPDAMSMDAIPMSQTRLRKVIHEVNNLLGIMKNYIKILHLKMNKEDPAQFGLGVIDEEIDRVARIVGGLTKAAEAPSAAESMRSGGEIVISTRDEVKLDGANYVEIAVADSGPGIAPEVLAHLFEPVTSTKGDEHFGLGLNIVYGLVRELGGTIRCKSDDKNGTCFQILLPSVLSVA